MKKIISVVIAIVVCLSLVGVVMAAEGVFTPSVTYKGQPDVTAVEGADGTGCLRIVPYAEREALLSAEEAALLEEVYTKLESGELKLPKEEAVVRELLDVALTCDHDHRAQFDAGEIAITVTFDLGVEADDVVSVYSYVKVDNEYKWVEAQVVNNGDGTVSATFAKLCPVAIAVG